MTSVQVIQSLLDTEEIGNLVYDATTIGNKHIYEIHMNPDGGSLLDVRTLAGGTAKDYCDHNTSALKTAVKAYCEVCKSEFSETLAKVQKQSTCTMSDQAIFDSSVAKLLEGYLGHSLLMLKCNAHPADAIASAFRNATKIMKKSECSRFTLRARCIHGNSSLQHNQTTFQARLWRPSSTKRFHEK